MFVQRDDVTGFQVRLTAHYASDASRNDRVVSQAAAPAGPHRGQGLPRVPDHGRYRTARGPPHSAVRAEGLPTLYVAQLLHNVVDILHLLYLAVSCVALPLKCWPDPSIRTKGLHWAADEPEASLVPHMPHASFADLRCTRAVSVFSLAKTRTPAVLTFFYQCRDVHVRTRAPALVHALERDAASEDAEDPA